MGRPNVKDVHFHEGEPLRFKAEFEVAPEIELKDYRGVTVHYSEPQVSDEDIAKRLEEIREQKSQFVNIEPRAGCGWRLRGGYARQSVGRRSADPSGRSCAARGRSRYDDRLLRSAARHVAGRRERVRRYVSGRLRSGAAGRQNRALPREADNHPHQRTAGVERRIRAGSGRLSRR